MADADKTLITRAQLNSLINATTKRFALVLDGQTIELGNTGFLDVSGSLEPTALKDGIITAGMLVVIRDGNVVTLKVNVTPVGTGQVQITKSGMSLGAAFAPDTTLWNDGRGGPIGISTAGVVYINPAVNLQKVDATLTFVVDNSWPTSLPGVALGQPLVV